MFMDLDHSLVRRHNEELMQEARKWHLQRSLRANRERRPGTRPRVDSRGMSNGVIETEQKGGAHMTLQLMATVLPVSAVRRKRDPRVRRDSGNTSEISAPRKAVAS